jgi:hypothetical protein
MSDNVTVRLVIGALALLVFAVVIGGIYLTAIDKSLPGELIAIGSAAAGAVAGILSKTGHNDPQPVVGPGGGPVPVVDENGRADMPFVVALATIWMAVVITVWAIRSSWWG